MYLLGHLGLDESCAPWTYEDVISHTNGIDVLLDGHSHDTEQVVMKNKDGETVVRSACGTKLNCIGYSFISLENGITNTNIWSWPNKDCAADLLGIQNSMSSSVNTAQQTVQEKLSEIIGYSAIELTVNDPVEKDSSGNPIHMIRRAETNLGDFCTDALRTILDCDIAILNGGAIRTNIDNGDITYGNIMDVFPFGNQTCVIEATGQQILDALEWGARAVPDAIGGFLQVSGLSYEIDVNIPSSCTQDENTMFTGVAGERRVKNVMVGDEPIDPDKTYTVGSIDYLLLNNGDGHTAFNGCSVLKDKVMLDNQLLISYITDYLDSSVGEGYADLYGQGRITIIE